jgi:glycosyltransferase involved in cell wall biosynthesis
LTIVFVNSAHPSLWGGGEKWTVEAAAYFHEHGHTVVVVGRPSSEVTKAARARGMMAEELRFGGDLDPFSLLRVRRLLKTHRPDLVVVNFNKEAWHFGLARKLLGIPLVARHGFPLVRNSFHHRLLIKRLMDKLIVNAESIREEYARLGLPTAEIEVIHNGVRVVPQRTGELRRKFGIAPDALLVIGAGRLESQKRFRMFIETITLLVPKFPKLKALIIGSGPEMPDLQILIMKQRLEKHIQLVGFQPDFASLIGDADLFMLTSEKEGTPNVLLEAMAAGVACVSFAVGAVPQILTGELAANAVEAGNALKLLERTSELLANDALRKSTAHKMQEHVLNHFSFEASMKRFEEIFNQMTRAGR